MKLLLNACVKFLIGAFGIGLMLFMPAGDFSYFGAWLFLGLLFCPMLLMGAVLLLRAPDLLEKRLNGKETEKTQQAVLALSGLMFPAGFVLSSLDHRFGWSRVPTWLVVASSALFLIGYLLYAEAMRENAYLSRSIEVQEGQKVISTGLYGLVRHPMYLATLMMFLPIPLILGSFWGLIPFGLYPVVTVIRIFNEEKVLADGLEGYTDYQKKVRYRLIPRIW